MEANNMMAMRDALLKVKRLFDGRIMFQQAIREAHEAVKSALAAPPRNCDVPHKDDHELWLRWQAFCAEIYPSRMSFSTWLLDLAQEGGAK